MGIPLGHGDLEGALQLRSVSADVEVGLLDVGDGVLVTGASTRAAARALDAPEARVARINDLDVCDEGKLAMQRDARKGVGVETYR